MPSASQKRFCAKGRSLLMVKMTTSSREDAALLNARALAAQTPVSRLGTILRILIFPSKSARSTSLRSDFVSLKSGAVVPLAGREPIVWIGLPLNVIFAIFMLLWISIYIKYIKNHILSSSQD